MTGERGFGEKGRPKRPAGINKILSQIVEDLCAEKLGLLEAAARFRDLDKILPERYRGQFRLRGWRRRHLWGGQAHRSGPGRGNQLRRGQRGMTSLLTGCGSKAAVVMDAFIVRIRHFGLLASVNVATKLQRCRELLGQGAKPARQRLEYTG